MLDFVGSSLQRLQLFIEYDRIYEGFTKLVPKKFGKTLNFSL
jgi:hypothetical protein